VGTYLLPHQLQLNNMPGPLADMPLPVWQGLQFQHTGAPQ
jgi:hypothetical protein